MGFKDFHLKLKVFKLKRFLGGGGGGKGKRESENGNGMKPSWMVPVSHGYHVVEEQRSFMKRTGELDLGFDSVVVQREQIEEHELWFFGVFDPLIGDGVTKYIQSHLFHNKHPKDQIRRKSKETMKKAYICARAKMRGTKNPEERRKVGSASAIVIDGENLVVANMGDYKAVVCKEGEAYQFTRRHQLTTKRHWSRKFFPGAIWIPKVRIIASDSGTTVPTKSSELIVGSERIDADTEFVILASTGIWEVMKHQEAVNLIRHIEDPQEAAECLAKEALARMSRRNVSCLVIRFD